MKIFMDNSTCQFEGKDSAVAMQSEYFAAGHMRPQTKASGNGHLIFRGNHITDRKVIANSKGL
jgi:hypothetical protein